MNVVTVECPGCGLTTSSTGPAKDKFSCPGCGAVFRIRRRDGDPPAEPPPPVKTFADAAPSAPADKPVAAKPAPPFKPLPVNPAVPAIPPPANVPPPGVSAGRYAEFSDTGWVVTAAAAAPPMVAPPQARPAGGRDAGKPPRPEPARPAVSSDPGSTASDDALPAVSPTAAKVVAPPPTSAAPASPSVKPSTRPAPAPPAKAAAAQPPAKPVAAGPSAPKAAAPMDALPEDTDELPTIAPKAGKPPTGTIPLEESDDAMKAVDAPKARPDKEAVWDYFDMMSAAPADPASAAAAGEEDDEDIPVAGTPTGSGKISIDAMAELAKGDVVTPAPTLGADAETATAAGGAGSSVAPAEAPDPLIGKNLGGCVIMRKLGQGGMGSVYEARQLSLDRRVAVKVLAPALSANSEFLGRFTREALAAAKLAHHNVVQIYDVGAAGGHHFFTMELVRGETLGQIRKRTEKLKLSKALRYIHQAARGLQFAHEHGIIHRDIKPANLMLNEQGLVKVADLGLAKRLGGDDESGSGEGEAVTAVKLHAAMASELTQAEAALGTPGFMAPEQVGDTRRVDGRADVYALGATLHQLLTGKLPFPGKNLMEMLRKQVSQKIPELPELAAAGVPDRVAALIRRMLAPDPENRPATMAEVTAELESALREYGRATAPAAEATAALGKCAVGYADASALAGWVGPLTAAVLAVLVLAVGLTTERTDLLIVGAVLPLIAAPTFTVLEAVTGRSTLCRRLLDCLISAPLRTHVEAGLVAAAVVGGAIAAGVILPALTGVGVGIAAGLIWHALARLVSGSAAAARAAADKLVTEMRAADIDEMVIQDTVLQAGAERSAPLFEAIFGWAALEAARRRVAAQTPGATVPRSLRDRIMSRLDRIARGRDDAGRRDDENQDELRASQGQRARRESREVAIKKAEVMERLAKMAEDVAESERHESELTQRVAGFKGTPEAFATLKEKLRRLRAKLYGQRTAFETFRRSALGIVKGTSLMDDDQGPGMSIPRLAAGVLVLGAVFLLPAVGEAGSVPAGKVMRMSAGGATLANGVFAGLALLISGLRRGGMSSALTAIGGLIAWPVAAFVGDLWPALLPAKTFEFLPSAPAGFPAAGVPLFWAGVGLFALGVLMTALEVFQAWRKKPAADAEQQLETL